MDFKTMRSIAPEAITLKEAGRLMAEPLGKRWPNDRDEIVHRINELRTLIRNLFPDNPIFRNATYAIPVSSFIDAGGFKFRGFSLPLDLAGVDGVFVGKDPVTLRSRWRELQVGIIDKYAVEYESIPAMKTSVTELDLLHPARIQIKSSSSCDDDKIVEVRVNLHCGTQKKIKFRLCSDHWRMSNSVAVSIESVILPEDLVGSTAIRGEGGDTLSVYGPGITIPSFERFRLTSDCFYHSLRNPQVVLVQGPRRFTKIFDDNDIMEIGDLLVLKHGASFLRYGSNTKEDSDLRKANFEKGQMIENLNGVFARIDGRSNQDGTVVMAQPNPMPNALPNGYIRR